MDNLDRCPDHGTDEPLGEWACPDECGYFNAELERRVHDVKVNGNFTRLTVDDDGVRMKQVFRNHQPVGPPTPW